ncbi:asparaginase [Sulfurimonas aquatica]|uniref:Asparaginase n=1 Tax=Sulfurimonas aquatica TaxID=2672570 RepID=A0A975AZ85_9BACT|nr:asparaginase domain-containing protein [Sulfurimonas aquatica]QSZ41314.1 asparaginase [Sulfurimonas aquatica]
MFILNCGGTFNKRYNKLNGELEVPFDNNAIEKILDSSTENNTISGAIYKDSIDMLSSDRKAIADIILHSVEDKFIVIHGTDTMSLTAEFLAEVIKNKTVVLTGAMKPFEIDNIESTLNLGISIGFVNGNNKHGIFIAMNGFVEPWNNVVKNKVLGKFELVR